MLDLSYLSRWAYEESYSLLRLERGIVKMLETFPSSVPVQMWGSLSVVRGRLSDLRSLEWDAVALAERSLAFADRPYMETRHWRVYTLPNLRRKARDKNPFLYERKGGGVYAIPDSLFPF